MIINGTVEVGYGTLKPARATTSWGALHDRPAPSAAFTFAALLPGRTTLPHRTKLRFAVLPDTPPPELHLTVDRFTTGNFTAGATTQLTLSAAPDTNNLSITLVISGENRSFQRPDEYRTKGTTLTFTSAIPVGTTIVSVTYISQAAQTVAQWPAWSAAMHAQSYLPLTRDMEIVSCDAQNQAAITSGAAPVVPPEHRSAEVRNTTVRRISRVKVKAISTWSAGMEIIARIDDGVMDADDQGHFSGSASVTWQTSVIGSPGCGAAEYPVAPSRAELAGEIDGSNQLVVRITFEPRDFSGFATCLVTVATSNVGTPHPLTISVPATGGTSTQPHAVTAKNGTFVGSATIVVTPERK